MDKPCAHSMIDMDYTKDYATEWDHIHYRGKCVGCGKVFELRYKHVETVEIANSTASPD